MEDRGARPQADSVKSVAKVLDILEHLGSSQRAVSVSDLARATGFNVSTAFRLLQTLMARGYVEQERGNRGYFLGPRIFQMGSAYLQGSDLATIARPHLEALRDEVGETAYLVIVQPGRDRAALQGRRQAGGERGDPLDGARARLLHGDRQGAALGARRRTSSTDICRASRCRSFTPQTHDQQDASCGARSRKRARERLRARRRGVRAEPVLRQRAGARITTAAHRSPRSASRCRRCASRSAQRSALVRA